MASSVSSTAPAPSPSTLPPSPQAYTLTHLDSLLATYLTLLDDYTTAHDQLNTSLQAGFLHLAQAQRSSMLPPGQRYGKEMYDQRMKAQRRVRIVGLSESEVEEEEEGTGQEERGEKEGGMVGFEIYTYPEEDPEARSTTQTKIETHTQTQTDLEKEIRTSTTPHSQSSPSPTTPEDTSQQHAPTTAHPSDPHSTPFPTNIPTSASPSTDPTPPPPLPNPLTQFSPLPPPPLRHSQQSFTTALLTTTILLNTSRQMLQLEGEITRARAAVGLDRDLDLKNGIANDAGMEDEDDYEGGKDSTPTSPIRRGLASRRKMSEPRSRVLKLGT